MAIIGFNYTKIHIEKNKVATGNISIRNNVQIKEVKKADFSLQASKQSCLVFSFEFTSKYEPEVATMVYAGEILFLDSEEKLAKILESWDKTKSVSPEVTREVINTALTKCNVQAIVMSQEMGLPSPVPLPRIEDRPAQAASTSSVAADKAEAKPTPKADQQKLKGKK